MSAERIALFYCHKVYASGITAFTAHLFKALQSQRHDVRIFVPCVPPGALGDSLRVDQFGEYAKDMNIAQLTPFQAISMAKDTPSLIVAPASPAHLHDPKLMHKLQQSGARVVVHDPTQLRNFPAPLVQPPILVRKAMLKMYPKGVYIPHPYVSVGRRAGPVRTRFAVSTARLATSKRTRLILQANRELPKRLRIQLKGAAENRMFTFGLSKTYADVFTQPKKPLSYPMTFAAPVDLCRHYRYHVDLTKFEGDGGGTQYAQLEAIDAGCVPIMHDDWFSQDGDLRRGINALGCVDAKHLAGMLIASDRHDYYRDTDAILREHGRLLLKLHDHEEVGKMYAEELGV